MGPVYHNQQVESIITQQSLKLSRQQENEKYAER